MHSVNINRINDDLAKVQTVTLFGWLVISKIRLPPFNQTQNTLKPMTNRHERRLKSVKLPCRKIFMDKLSFILRFKFWVIFTFFKGGQLPVLDSPHSHPYFIGGKRHTTLQLQLRTSSAPAPQQLRSSSAAAPHRLRTGSVPAPHQLRTSSAAAPHQLHTESRSFGIFHSSGLAESAYFQSDSFCWGFVQSIAKKQIFVIMVVQNCK